MQLLLFGLCRTQQPLLYCSRSMRSHAISHLNYVEVREWDWSYPTRIEAGKIIGFIVDNTCATRSTGFLFQTYKRCLLTYKPQRTICRWNWGRQKHWTHSRNIWKPTYSNNPPDDGPHLASLLHMFIFNNYPTIVNIVESPLYHWLCIYGDLRIFL